MDIPQEEHEARLNQMYDDFSQFITDHVDEHGPMTVGDFGVMTYIIAGKLRGTLLPEETGTIIAQAMGAAEQTIQKLLEEGHEIIVAEQYRGMEDSDEVLKDLTVGLEEDYFPEEWLQEGESNEEE